MQKYQRHVNDRATPQTEPLPGTVENSAGGQSYKVSRWQQLDRFLILGAEGGTYYVSERDLTKQNLTAVKECLAEDGPRAVARIAEVSERGLAPKNDPALFALACATGSPDLATRQAAYQALPRVARIGTHLFHFMEYRKVFGGDGSGFRRAVRRWYAGKTPEQLAYDLVKYRQRDGWAARDVLRVAHPPHSPVFRWAAGKPVEEALPQVIQDFQAVQVEGADWRKLLNAVARLPREALPTKWLTVPEVWAALLPGMPLTALIRNLGNIGKCGLLKPMSDASRTVVAKLADENALREARVHPVAVLLALATYASGHGLRGSGEWLVVPAVVDALDDAFYKAFANVEATGKRFLLGIDISGSMDGNRIAGTPLDARQGAAAMAMVAVRTEPNVQPMAFATEFTELPLSRKLRLDAVIKEMRQLRMGGTDCSLPMLYALRHKLPVDCFIVYTDSETWAGEMHATQALKKYRDSTGIPAKLIVVGMCANEFSIADPNDPGMLDVVGFSADVPQVMRQFVVSEP